MKHTLELPRPVRSGLLRALSALLLASLALPANAQVPSADVTTSCRLADPNASGLHIDEVCWLQFGDAGTDLPTGYNQTHNFTLPDGSTLHLRVTVAGTNVNASPRMIVSQAPTWIGSNFSGTSGYYTLLTPNSAALHSEGGSGDQLAVELSDIRIFNPAGTEVTDVAFEMVVADAERLNTPGNPGGERLDFGVRSGGTPLSVVEWLGSGGAFFNVEEITLPEAGVASTCVPGTDVSCRRFHGTAATDASAVVVSTQRDLASSDPFTIVGQLHSDTGGQSFAYGIRWGGVRVRENLPQGRVAASDQFAYRIVNVADTIVANTTTSGSATGNYDYISGQAAMPGNTLTLIQEMAPGSASPLSYYQSTISCTNINTGSSTVLPSGTYDPDNPPVVDLRELGDSVDCTITNIPLPADVTTSVSAPATAAPGVAVSSTVTFTNAGVQTAADVTYGIQLPAGLSGVSCDGATCGYDAATGVVTITGLPASLSAGQSASLVLHYTAPAATGSVTVAASIGTSSDQGANAQPDTASDSTTIAAGGSTADVVALVDAPPMATAGSTVNVPISFANLGPLAATGVGYSLQLPSGLSGVSCASATCAYNSATGVVTVSGLPASLAANGSAALTLSYTAPASGSVTVAATVSTATTESDAGNNTASGVTVISEAPTADVTVSVAPPASAAPGSTVNVPVSYRNLGPQTAAAVGYTLTLSSGLTGVSCQGATCSYDSGSGVVTLSGTPASLANGQAFAFTIAYTAPASGPVAVTASTSTSTAESNSANNSAQAATAIADEPDLVTTIGSVTTAEAGGTVSAPVTINNAGNVTANGVSYTLSLAPGLSGVSCSGATCSYDSGTGLVTVTGLPTTLAAGASTSYTVQFTAPASGSVPIGAGVATTTTESVLSNNTDTAAAAVRTPVVPVPVLGPIGMGMLALLVGLVPGFAARRRKA